MNDAMNGDICDVCEAVESNVHFEMHRRTSASNSTCVLYYRHNASYIYVIMQRCATYMCGAMHWINREMHLIVETVLSREGLDPASCPPPAVDGETT